MVGLNIERLYVIMKENKNVNYKARLWIDENGELHGISFANRQIPLGLFDMLNKAMHEVVDTVNGKTSWKENYIKFTSNGKRYEQFDGSDVNIPCNDCIFRGNPGHCQHPHYLDGTKGYCGKPYREVKE